MVTLLSPNPDSVTPSSSSPSPVFPRISRKLKWVEYIPHVPTAKQLAFLLLDGFEEAFYGGAAGGGKSDALLMAALQYVDVKGYAALLFRKSYSDLVLPGALMDRAREWLAGKKANWKEQEKTWHFPSGASVTFGYLDNDADVYRYQSSEFQFIGFDELTQFKEFQYRYMFSRLRRLADAPVPLRVRAASNPGNTGHDWVKQRFITEGQEKGRPFIRATLDDNPFLDRAEYVKSLQELDPVTRDQLLRGDWSARTSGGKFRREWFKIVEVAPIGLQQVRYWDMAATEKNSHNEPDWTAGCKLGKSREGNYYLMDMRRTRTTPQQVENLIKQTAQLDGLNTTVYMEQEAGASGKSLIDYYRRKVLSAFSFYSDKPTASKVIRADPVSSQAEAGNVYLVRGTWINDFLDEAESFPNGSHDDQVDAFSGAFAQLNGAREYGFSFAGESREVTE